MSALALSIAFPIFGEKTFCFWIHVHFWDFVLDFHIPPEVNYHVDLNHYPSGFRYVHMPFNHLPAASWLVYPLVQLKWFFLATLSDSSWSGISNRWSSTTFLPMQTNHPVKLPWFMQLFSTTDTDLYHVRMLRVGSGCCFSLCLRKNLSTLDEL